MRFNPRTGYLELRPKGSGLRSGWRSWFRVRVRNRVYVGDVAFPAGYEGRKIRFKVEVLEEKAGVRA